MSGAPCTDSSGIRSRFLLKWQCLLDFRTSLEILVVCLFSSSSHFCWRAHYNACSVLNYLGLLWSPVAALLDCQYPAAPAHQHSSTALSRLLFSESCFSSVQTIQIKPGNSLCIKFSVRMHNRNHGFYMINRAVRTCLRFNFLIVKV